jgi:prepilin-type N-terminal cleavage/methylation domain-containing protein
MKINQKGVTLVELLAAISILTIISAIIYSVFLGANKSYNQISEKASFEQEANIIIATIKNYQLKPDVNYSYRLTCDSTNGKVFVGEFPPSGQTGTLTQLGRDDFFITVRIDNDAYQNTNTPVIPNVPEYQHIYVSRPLYIDLKVENKQHTQFYEITTTIKRY